MVSLISKKYSEALYMVGNERNNLSVLCDEIKEIKKIFEMDKNIMISLNHPKLPLSVKKEIIKEMFEGKVSKEILGLFDIVLRKSRQEHLIDIFSEFIEKCLKHDNTVNATLSFAEHVDDKVVNTIKVKIEQSISKKVNIETKIDKTLIAGYKVKVDDLLFDGTIDGKIKNLKKAIS